MLTGLVADMSGFEQTQNDHKKSGQLVTPSPVAASGQGFPDILTMQKKIKGLLEKMQEILQVRLEQVGFSRKYRIPNAHVQLQLYEESSECWRRSLKFR